MPLHQLILCNNCNFNRYVCVNCVIIMNLDINLCVLRTTGGIHKGAGMLMPFLICSVR